MSQPDPTAIFAEFDTDGDKQVCALSRASVVTIQPASQPESIAKDPAASTLFCTAHCSATALTSCFMMVMQIDRDELRAGFLKLGEKLSEEDIDAIMELADDDGDDTIDITVLTVLHCTRLLVNILSMRLELLSIILS